ncbi:MAG: hypothetical protein AAFV53_43515 [Myxococcota bacterium]
MKFHRDEALALARASRHVWVANRKKLLKFDLSMGTTDDELAKAILGRSGTLRAPAIRTGDTFIVGFHSEGYAELFGD